MVEEEEAFCRKHEQAPARMAGTKGGEKKADAQQSSRLCVGGSSLGSLWSGAEAGQRQAGGRPAPRCSSSGGAVLGCAAGAGVGVGAGGCVMGLSDLEGGDAAAAAR